MKRNALSVDGRTVSLEQLLKLARLSDTMPVVGACIDDLAIAQWAERLGVSAESGELQGELTQFRRQRGLFSAAAAAEWLRARGAELDELVDLLRPRVLRRKLVDLVVQEEQIERYFIENRLAFDLAELSRIVMPEYGQARELLYRMEEGADFHRLAREFSADDETRRSGGYSGVAGRDDIEPVASSAVFHAKPGDVLGPFELKNGCLLLKVEAIYPAELDEHTRMAIRERLFEAEFTAFKESLEIREEIWMLK